MPEYREIAPPPGLAHMVECFWTGRASPGEPPYRVMPDGCADVVFTRSGGGIRLDAVGPMTVYRDYALSAGTCLLGMRLRPGMWRAHLGIPGDRLTDSVLPLEDLWGARARTLLDRLAAARSVAEEATLLSPPPAVSGPAQKAISWIEARHGCISIDELAHAAGLSPRQFRRVCLELTGLTPKFLARVLRFRRALAADCGYYDQPHLIRDFREFAGRTPMAVLYNPASAGSATINP